MYLTIPERDVVICPVGEELLPALLNLYYECEDFLALGPEPHASEEIVRRDLASMRAENAEFHGIFDAAGTLLGVLDVIQRGYRGNPVCAYIELLMLRASARNAGLGAAVCSALEAHLSARGIQEIQADVQVNNPLAQRFWQRMGFEIIGGPIHQADTTVTYMLRKPISAVKAGAESSQ